MQVFLLCEKSPNNLLKKIFKKITLEDDKIILNFEIKDLSLKQKIKVVEKINNIVNSNKNIILSKNLKADEELTNILYSNNFNIVNGKKLLKILINKYVEFICLKIKIQIRNCQIAITVNDEKNINIDDVQELAKKCKTLNIVTNNLKSFKNLKEKLWDEFGIILVITNNKKKALQKADIILNYDFPEENLNKYTINDKAILVNLRENVKIVKKRFNGKIINNYKIKLKERSNIKQILMSKKYKEFDLNDLTEVYVLNDIEEKENIIFID